MKPYILVLVYTFIAACVADCPHDNVLRCLIGSSAVASPYCSSFLGSYYEVTSAETVETMTLVPARRAAPSPMPNCLTQVSHSLYPTSRISSACSCFGVTTGPKVPTGTTTVEVTATVTPPPECTSTVVYPEGYPYTRYYFGIGFIEDPQNPGNNALEPAQTTSIPSTTSPCDAVHDCALWAVGSPSGYYSFDLHFYPSVGWECISYFNWVTDPTWFDISSNTTGAYGFYFIPLP